MLLESVTNKNTSKILLFNFYSSCCDPHIPASTLALKAFSTAFNGDESKHNEAIFFCQMEILNNISDNLLVHTASTLSDPKWVLGGIFDLTTF